MNTNFYLKYFDNLFASADEFDKLMKTVSYDSFLSDRLNIKDAELQQVRTARSNRGVNLVELETLLNNGGCGRIVFECGHIIYTAAGGDDKFPVYFDVPRNEQKLRIIISMMQSGLPLTDIRRFVILAESLDWHTPVNLRTAYRKDRFVLKAVVAGAVAGTLLAAATGYLIGVKFLPALLLLLVPTAALVAVSSVFLKRRAAESESSRRLVEHCALNVQHPVDFYIKYKQPGTENGVLGKALSFERANAEKL